MAIKHLNAKKIIGFFILAIGVLATKSNLLKIFSMYALIQIDNVIPIWLLRTFLISIGLIIIFIKIDLQKIIKYYKQIAVILFSALLIFSLINFTSSIALLLDQYKHYKDYFLINNEKKFISLYPFSKNETYKLLSETWSRPFEFEAYTLFKEKAFKGKYVNVSKDGFRLVKNQGPWPPKKENINIFLFGGSVAFNYSLPDDKTIASFIQENLRKDFGNKICIYNFGRGYYFSSQERILFEKLLIAGFVPNIALFLDGINEFYFKNDEPLLSDALSGGLTKNNVLLNSDFIKLITRRANNNGVYETLGTEKELIAEKIVNRYFLNKKMIESIASSFNVTPLFIWQPAPTYKYDLNYHPFSMGGFGRHSFSNYGYEVMEKTIQKNKPSNNFLNIADLQENIKHPLYVDKTHYTVETSEKVAKEMYLFIKERGGLN